LGVFFLFSTVAFAADIADMGRQPALLLTTSVLITGSSTVIYAVAGFVLRKRFWMAFLPLFALHLFLMHVLFRSIPTGPQPAQLDAAQILQMHQRLRFDARAIILGIALGYICFLYVSITQASRYFRARAEIDLAVEIHRVLVPLIDAKIGEYQFYGRSSASGDVGGDLIDLAGSDEHWVAYVADVAGHGVAPGVVMGMIKSAARMLLSSGDDTRHFLPRLNEVLYPLKKPDMFATFCFLARDGDGLQVGLAGHPAILHYSARTNEVTLLEGHNLPLGILPSAEFASSEIRPEAGDVFAMYTDGFLETANAAGEEFGLTRLSEEVQKHCKEPLDALFLSIQKSVARHGRQFDDQSLLLIRRL
jgi:sigma-B regulation protein RsbU (phosphoserine phosphatase)